MNKARPYPRAAGGVYLARTPRKPPPDAAIESALLLTARSFLFVWPWLIQSIFFLVKPFFSKAPQQNWRLRSPRLVAGSRGARAARWALGLELGFASATLPEAGNGSEGQG